MVAAALILILAAFCALVELDGASAGQFMVSRPIVLGPALGALLGRPALGAGLGALIELFCLEELPMGASLPLNATAAVSVAVVLAAGPARVAPELALPVGLLAGWAHRRVETALRRRRAALNLLVERRLDEGKDPGLGALTFQELARQAAATFAVVALFLACGAWLAAGWQASPSALKAGLRFGFSVSPWLGLWSLARSFKVVS